MWKSETVNCSVVSDSLWLLGLYSPPGSSVHGILQARILEWVTTPSVGDQTQVSCNVGRFFTIWAREALILHLVCVYISMLLSQFTATSASPSVSPVGSLHLPKTILILQTLQHLPQRELPIKMFISDISNCGSHILYQEIQNILKL